MMQSVQLCTLESGHSIVHVHLHYNIELKLFAICTAVVVLGSKCTLESGTLYILERGRCIVQVHCTAILNLNFLQFAQQWLLCKFCTAVVVLGIKFTLESGHSKVQMHYIAILNFLQFAQQWLLANWKAGAL